MRRQNVQKPPTIKGMAKRVRVDMLRYNTAAVVMLKSTVATMAVGSEGT